MGPLYDVKYDDEQENAGARKGSDLPRNIIAGGIGAIVFPLAALVGVLVCIGVPALIFNPAKEYWYSLLFLLCVRDNYDVLPFIDMGIALTGLLFISIVTITVGVVLAVISLLIAQKTSPFAFLEGTAFPLSFHHTLSPLTTAVPLWVARSLFHVPLAVMSLVAFGVSVLFGSNTFTLISAAVLWYTLARSINPVHIGPSGWLVLAVALGTLSYFCIPNVWLMFVFVNAIPLITPLLALAPVIGDEYDGFLFGAASGLAYAAAASVVPWAEMSDDTFMADIITPVPTRQYLIVHALYPPVYCLAPCLFGVLIGTIKAGWITVIIPTMPHIAAQAMGVIIILITVPVAYVVGWLTIAGLPDITVSCSDWLMPTPITTWVVSCLLLVAVLVVANALWGVRKWRVRSGERVICEARPPQKADFLGDV